MVLEGFCPKTLVDPNGVEAEAEPEPEPKTEEPCLFDGGAPNELGADVVGGVWEDTLPKRPFPVEVVVLLWDAAPKRPAEPWLGTAEPNNDPLELPLVLVCPKLKVGVDLGGSGMLGGWKGRMRSCSADQCMRVGGGTRKI